MGHRIWGLNWSGLELIEPLVTENSKVGKWTFFDGLIIFWWNGISNYNAIFFFVLFCASGTVSLFIHCCSCSVCVTDQSTQPVSHGNVCVTNTSKQRHSNQNNTLRKTARDSTKRSAKHATVCKLQTETRTMLQNYTSKITIQKTAAEVLSLLAVFKHSPTNSQTPFWVILCGSHAHFPPHCCPSLHWNT